MSIPSNRDKFEKRILLWNDLIKGRMFSIKTSRTSKTAAEPDSMVLNLTSHWHQDSPYNNDCPDLGCTTTSNGRSVVGCVATAGAQIMYYWAWPPYGEGSPYSDTYDWPNMRDSVTTSSPAAQQAAVAELSHEVGLAVGMS